ncbi:MAG TPA: GldG family protein, partial [Candidatus Saccharimonadales bacterium]|nr:GldG family protein [Candidatus Saccharimonadales bacterium]
MGVLRRYSWVAGFPVLGAGFTILVLFPGHRSWATGAVLLGGVMLLAGVLLNFRDLAAIARGRSVRYGANAVFYSLLVLGILAAVNFLASRHRARVDLTQGGVHTLAPQTVKVLDGLGKDVEVIGFFTDQMGGERQKFQDLAEEYEYESSHFKARTVDPRRSPGEAEMHKIVQDGTVIVQAPSGDARITSVSEQSLTNAIVKATRGTHPEVCFTTGHGEASRSDDGPEGFHMVTTALEGEGYKTRDVLLIRQPEVPEDCDVLVTAGPSTPLIPSEVAEISRYLKAGGRLLVLKRNPADRIGLDGLLADYGLRVNSDTIVDRLSKAMGGDEFSPVVVSYEAHPVTKALEDNGIATFFPVASSVDAVKATEKGVTSEIVARTSDAAWGETGKVARFDKTEDHPGPVGIVAVASGPAAAPEPVEPASKASAA